MATFDSKTADRFWSKVSKKVEPPCWTWTGALFTTGYGQFRFPHKNARAHRVAWELINGKIPKGMHVLHTCDNPRCVRPSHLYVGSNQDNVDDKLRKGRQPFGEWHGVSKLSVEKVEAIRARATENLRVLAAVFKVSKATVWRVVRGINWTH